MTISGITAGASAVPVTATTSNLRAITNAEVAAARGTAAEATLLAELGDQTRALQTQLQSLNDQIAQTPVTDVAALASLRGKLDGVDGQLASLQTQVKYLDGKLSAGAVQMFELVASAQGWVGR